MFPAPDTPELPGLVPKVCPACGRSAWDSQEGRQVCTWCGHYEIDRRAKDADEDA